MDTQEQRSDRVHAYKHRQPGETYRDSCARVASALKDDDDHFRQCLEIMGARRFHPGGRVHAGAGTAKSVTLYNCFVSGVIRDSFVDGDGSIMDRAKEAAATMRTGGGIGYDFSDLRPAGDIIRGVQGRTDGPLAFLPIYDAVCKATSSSGNRRGAQMGVLRVDHPDIRSFITAKHDLGKLTGFNLSVGVTDEFMNAVEQGLEFPLSFGGQERELVDARELWEMIMRSTWDYAEPGVLFLDTINNRNPLNYCERIAATNPCGEQPLPQFGACLLGSFNLARYVTDGGFDWDLFAFDIPPIVRMMDNVVDKSRYPLGMQEAEAKNKRRMGLGITGFANASEMMRMTYGLPASLAFLDHVLEEMRYYVMTSSAQLGAQKGSFPLFDADKYLATEYGKDLSDDIRWSIRKFGLRNSHHLSIAPTGSISFGAFEYVSSGIEPVSEYDEDRFVIMPDGPEVMRCEDYAWRKYGVEGKRTKDVTAKEHVAVLTTAARKVDSAVSKTCNVNPNMEWDAFKQIYVDAWRGDAKGCTTFNPGGKRAGIFVKKDDDDSEKAVGMSCEIDPATGRRNCE